MKPRESGCAAAGATTGCAPRARPGPRAAVRRPGHRHPGVLRFQLPHAALAVFYGVDRSTITRAVGEIRPLLAARGFAVPGEPGLRLRTLADVFAYAAARRRRRCASTAPRCRSGARARASRAAARSSPARRSRTPTRPPSSATGKAGPCGWRVPPRPDARQTAVRTEGIEDLLRQHPEVTAEVDAGYHGLARTSPARSAPRRTKPKRRPGRRSPSRGADRQQQSSQRICVEHAIAEPKQWRPMQRYIGRRDYFHDTAMAIAGLVSDRAAER